MKARLRKFAFVALGWIDESLTPAVDVVFALLYLLLLTGFIGAVIPYAPMVLFGDHLAQSAGAWMAYRCLAGPTCDYYSLMGSLALGLFISGAVIVIILLPSMRWLDWKEAERELAAEEAAEAEASEPGEVRGLNLNGGALGKAQGIGAKGPT